MTLEQDRRRSRLLAKKNPDNVIKDIDVNSPVPKGTFKEMGEYIITYQHPLTFKGYELDTTSIQKFVHKFFELNDKHITIKQGTSTVGMCGKGMRRSLPDIFLITRSYFPKVGLLTVLKHVLEIPNIDSNLCSIIKRRVYMIRPGGAVLANNAQAHDELGYNLSQLKAEANKHKP